MNENLPEKDHLEQFLREGLEGYEESPPESVWLGISSQPHSAPSQAILYRKRLIWISSAAAMILILLVAQHFYFQYRIQQLQEVISEQHQAEEPTEDAALSDQGLFNSAVPSKEGQSDVFSPESPDLLPTDEPSPGKSISEQKSTASDASRGRKPLLVPAFPSSPHKETGILLRDSLNKANSLPEAVDSLETIRSKPRVIAEREAVAPFQALDVRSEVTRMQEKEVPAIQAFTPPIQPLRHKRLQLEAFLKRGVNSYTQSIERLPDIPPFIKEPAQRKLQSSQSIQAGVQAGLRISPRWTLISGLLHQQSNKQETHQLSFLRRDRKGHIPGQSGGPEAFKYDYQYKLNCSSGLVDMELSLVQRNTDVIPEDDSSFDIEVLTEESNSSWSVPLLLEYRAGNQRFKPFIRTGILAHFGIDNQFEVKNVSTPDDFLIQQPQERSRGMLAYEADHRIDFMLSLGVGYQISKNWSLNVMPSYTSSLTDSNRHPLIEGKSRNWGVGTSLQYTF